MAIIGEMKKLTIGGSTYTIPEYNLPIASASTLGGVKIGTGLTINSTTGVLSATGLDFDEADPVFTASAAYGITSTDITNWNSKTSNTGTITKVQTSAGAHTIVNVSSGNVSFNVPTKTSHLTNDSGFLTSSDLASVLKYKGTKASVANLPTTGNITGDVWHITADGSEYAWDGSIWQELGTAIDLSGYALKSELPTDTNTWRTIQVDGSDILGSGIDTEKLNLKAGNAITLSESSGTVTFNHSDTSSQASSSNSGRTYIQSITLDTYGHVTGISTATETVTNTDTKLQVAAVTSGTTYYPIVGTGTTAATRQYDSTGIAYTGTNGTANGTNGNALLTLGNSTASTTANWKKGTVRLYGTTTYYIDLVSGAPSANRTITFPNATGTVALTSNIPTVPTKVSAFTNDAGYITSADVPEGASAYTGTISAVTSGNASAGSNNGFARGDHVHNITKTTITNALGYTPADILIGNTRNVTPTQVLTALQTGKTVYITHEVDTDLTIYATYFDYANILSIIVSSILVEVSGVYYVYILTGNISTNTWSVSNTALATNSSIPTVTNSNTTGITASTTATKTTLGTASSIYGVKSGTNSTTTASKASGSNGSASNWVFEDVACDDITAWSAGSGSASFSATVSSHVLSFSHSHTHTAPSLTYSAKTASHVKSGGNGTAPSWSFSDVTVPIRADSATSVPNVSVASATVTISDPGHTHTI